MSGINNRVAMVPAGDDVIPSWRALDRTSPPTHNIADLLEALHHQVVLHRAAAGAAAATEEESAQSASTNPVRAVRAEDRSSSMSVTYHIDVSDCFLPKVCKTDRPRGLPL